MIMQAASNPATWDLDEIDQQLIAMLEQDGRLSYADLAAEVGLTSGGARARVLRLQERGVIRITAVVDATSLGLDSIAALQVEVAGDRDLQEIAADISRVRGVRYVVLGSGRFTILVEVYADSPQNLFSVINSDIRAIPGVARVETFTYDRVFSHHPVFPIRVGERDSA